MAKGYEYDYLSFYIPVKYDRSLEDHQQRQEERQKVYDFNSGRVSGEQAALFLEGLGQIIDDKDEWLITDAYWNID